VIQDILTFLRHPDSVVINTVLLILQSHEEKIPLDGIRPLLRYHAVNAPVDGIRPLLRYHAVNAPDFTGLIQLHAAEILYKKGSSEGLQVLKKHMKSRDYSIRGHAAFVLSLYGGNEGRKLIELLLKREKDPGNRIELLRLLKPVPDELAIPILKKALAHHWPTTRWEAALALKELLVKYAHALAEEALQDEPDPLVQKALKRVLSDE